MKKIIITFIFSQILFIFHVMGADMKYKNNNYSIEINIEKQIISGHVYINNKKYLFNGKIKDNSGYATLLEGKKQVCSIEIHKLGKEKIEINFINIEYSHRNLNLLKIINLKKI